MSVPIDCRKCGKETAITRELECSNCGELVCLVCGCTESRACIDELTLMPCGWARPGVCTNCISKVDAMGNPNGAVVEQMVIENQANLQTNH